jgi:hypothetical protein
MTTGIQDLLATAAYALAIEDGDIVGDRLLVRRFWRWLAAYQTLEPPPAERPGFQTLRGNVANEYEWWDRGTTVFGSHSDSRTVWCIPTIALDQMPRIARDEPLATMSPEMRTMASWEDGAAALPNPRGRRLYIVGPGDASILPADEGDDSCAPR